MVILAGAACALVIVLAAPWLLPRIVTILAFRDAERMVREFWVRASRSPEKFFELRASRTPKDIDAWPIVNKLAKTYGALFHGGFFDPAYWMAQVPKLGFTPEALPAWLVMQAYSEAQEKELSELRRADRVKEYVRWFRPLFESARAKESLVNLLLRDCEPVPGKVESGGMFKALIMSRFTLQAFDNRDPELEAFAALVGPTLGARAWTATLRDSRHTREKVRAGALLLLCHHPDRTVFESRAREALRDPAEVVRIAAAGTLAYHGLADGKEVLIGGLAHERWEARWWCGKSLSYLGHEALVAWYKARNAEPDAWVRGDIDEEFEDAAARRDQPQL